MDGGKSCEELGKHTTLDIVHMGANINCNVFSLLLYYNYNYVIFSLYLK